MGDNLKKLGRGGLEWSSFIAIFITGRNQRRVVVIYSREEGGETGEEQLCPCPWHKGECLM
jgi:hypothetical protein